jgi:hypothetical protein
MKKILTQEQRSKMAKKYGQTCNYHAHRAHKLTKATKEQKDFSNGYMQFFVLFDTDEFTPKEKNEFLSEKMKIVKDKNHPEYEHAKGFMASMYDVKKFWPEEATIWGTIKRHLKGEKNV